MPLAGTKAAFRDLFVAPDLSSRCTSAFPKFQWPGGDAFPF